MRNKSLSMSNGKDNRIQVKRSLNCKVPRALPVGIYSENGNYSFPVVYQRDGPVQRDDLLAYLSNEVSSNLINPEYLKQAAEIAGLATVRQYLDEYVITRVTSTRNGDFGEILGSLMLREKEDYLIPIQKLRYREAKDWSPRLTDILALKVSNHTVQLVCYAEAKTRTLPDNDAGKEGYERLKRDSEVPHPEILHFVSARLWDTKNWPVLKLILQLFSSRADYVREFRLLLIYDRDAWRTKVLDVIEEVQPDINNFSVQVVLLSRLQCLIDDCYSRAGLLT